MSDQLTLEQAALSHANKAIESHRESKRTFTESLNISFQAGAEWQKEQYKGIKEALKIGEYYMRQYMIKMGQNATVPPNPDSPLGKVVSAIERLQDWGKF